VRRRTGKRAARKRAKPASRKIDFRALVRERGKGLLVAVIDSGITAGHPHVGPVSGGASFERTRSGRVVRGDDWRDRLGHGTACAGAIRELLPDADLLAVRVFDDRLSGRTAALVEGIHYALERGARVLNLSLAAFPRGAGGRSLGAALEAAGRARAAVVAALPPLGGRRGGGGLALHPHALAAASDPACPPGTFRAVSGRPPVFLASPFARPAPGIPPSSNFQGPSLAAARLSGFAGKIIARMGPLRASRLRGVLYLWARWAGEAIEMPTFRPVQLPPTFQAPESGSRLV